MEMVSLEQRARFRISWFGLCLIILVGCKMQPKGIARCEFYPGTTDTLAVTSFYNGLEHGEFRRFHENGVLMEQRYYVMGVKTGALKRYWNNGQIQAHYFFSTGEYQGNCREWNPEGKLVREMNYERGHESGSQKQWYDDGSIRSNYIIRNGRRYGLLGTKNCINVSDSVGIN
jgi:hypothetical protein